MQTLKNFLHPTNAKSVGAENLRDLQLVPSSSPLLDCGVGGNLDNPSPARFAVAWANREHQRNRFSVDISRLFGLGASDATECQQLTHSTPATPSCRGMAPIFS